MKHFKERDGLLTVLGLAAAVAGYLLAIEVPARREAERIRGEIALAQQAVRDVPLRVAELSSLQERVAERRRRLAAFRQAIPADGGLHTVLREVARLAEMSKLKVTRLEPLPPSAQASYQQLGIRMTISGEFHGIIGFLRALETRDRLFTFEQCSFRHELGGETSPIEADIHFSVYAASAGRSDFHELDGSSALGPSDTRRR